MPTYRQLEEESAWRAQFVPPNLKTLAANLEAYFEPGIVNVGVYGDNRHLKGYHRSRRWIQNSRYCSNRFYSVSETAGNRNGGNENWISGLDLVVGRVVASVVTARLNVARQHGRIPYVTQVLLERDPWHVHVSIDRAHADDDHTELYRIITGASEPKGKLVELDIQLPELREGSEGGHVCTAQALLVARGFPTTVDGEFGPDTNEKTLAMQRQYGAEGIDGIWGPETWTIAITGEDKR
jgi:Putative peptidoglycan-binding domain-containing protein